MKASELRGRSAAELKQLLLDKRKEQFNTRMQRGTGQPPRSSAVREARRDIARIKTILTEKQAGDA